LIERIIRVAPPHVHAGYTPATFVRMQQMDGVQFEEVLSFRRVPSGWIEGHFLGVELTIYDYAQFDWNLTKCQNGEAGIRTRGEV
jgi:hypothetical protein